MTVSRHQLKLYIHIAEIALIIMVIGFSVPRLFMKDQPRTRANTIALGMGAKSLIIIQYQLLTEYVARLRRWASTKANAILNSLEIVFWIAVVFLVIQANIQICVGIGCKLSWVVVALAIVMILLSAAAAYLSWVEHRESRSQRVDSNSPEHRREHNLKEMSSASSGEV